MTNTFIKKYTNVKTYRNVKKYTDVKSFRQECEKVYESKLIYE